MYSERVDITINKYNITMWRPGEAVFEETAQEQKYEYVGMELRTTINKRIYMKYINIRRISYNFRG